MYIYKEPTQPPLVELDINQKPTADQLAGWVGNRIRLSYIGHEYPNEEFYIRRRDRGALVNPVVIYAFAGFESGFYGGMMDLTNGVIYSWFDENGDYMNEPEELPLYWRRADEVDYTEGALSDRIEYLQDYVLYVDASWNQRHEYGKNLLFLTQSEETIMNIITGYVGQPHITAAQDRAANQGSYGGDSYILNVGNKLAATASSATEIHVADGVVSHQGCVGVIDQGTYDVVEISPGTQGYQRIDLIVCRYERLADTGEESLTVRAIEGTPAASNPAVPAYTQGDIQGGDLVADMPLFQVLIDGITIDSITKVASGVKTQAELDAAVAAAQAELNKISPFKRVAYHSNGSSTSATYTDTLTSGYSYIAIVGRSNSTNAGQNGFYLIRAHSSNSSVLAVASSSIATVSISGTTLTTVLSSAYATISVYMV